MGLDIVYASGLEFVADISEVDNLEFETIDIGLPGDGYDDDFYSRRLGILKPGCYSYRDKSSFRFGGYSFYGQWRNILSQSVHQRDANYVWTNAQSYVDTPFYELIDFSDCCGAIGTDICQKLAKDFKKWKDEFISCLSLKENPLSGMYVDKYEEFAKAFVEASDNGVVLFR